MLVSERTNDIYDWPQVNLGQFFIKFKNKNFLERLYWTLQRRKSGVYTKRNSIAKKIEHPFPKATHLPGVLKMKKRVLKRFMPKKSVNTKR